MISLENRNKHISNLSFNDYIQETCLGVSAYDLRTWYEQGLTPDEAIQACSYMLSNYTSAKEAGETIINRRL